MSIVLLGSTSGSVTLQEPAVAGTTVFNLPATTGTVALTSQLGVTEADQWRLTTNITTVVSQTVLSTGWERSDTYGAGYIGTGMTQSSGVFTFPSTGTWLIQISAYISVDASQRYNSIGIQTTTDNSTYNDAAYSSQFISRVNSNYTIGNLYTFLIFNVTNTTNCKVRFTQACEGTAGNIGGDTNANATSANFIRLGAST